MMTRFEKYLSAGFGVGGCLAMLATLGCANTPRTSEERAVDADIAEKVEAALGTDSRIYARHVDVNVDRGVVHLGGYVWSDSELQYAKADAAAVPGVLGVSDEMELMRGGISGTSR
jgi:osmotically-inducible protein OsmY